MNISWKQSHYKTTTLTEMKDGCRRLGEASYYKTPAVA